MSDSMRGTLKPSEVPPAFTVEELERIYLAIRRASSIDDAVIAKLAHMVGFTVYGSTLHINCENTIEIEVEVDSINGELQIVSRDSADE